jgi:peptidoglycan/LPS O-acetylase OafA/YrhL
MTIALQPGPVGRRAPNRVPGLARSATARESRLTFRPDIEGLRAVAVLLVVLYHAGWRWASGGFYGVDVFFVLSGYLITGLLVEEAARTGRVSLLRFWARRARRLLPASAVVTLAVLLANALLLSPPDQITYAGTARAFAAYASNLVFAARSTDYFAAAASHDPLLHTWSLAVEEQFYLFFAPLVLGIAAWTAWRGAPAFRRRFAIVAVALSVISLAACLVIAGRYPILAFYALPTRAWEFGIGAIAFVVAARAARLERAMLEWMGVLSLIMLFAVVALIEEGAVRPVGVVTLVPTLATAGILLSGGAAGPTAVGRFLSLSPIRLLGRLSYSWYLWHWPALVLLRSVVPDPSLGLNLLVAALALIPAAFTYAFVEAPIRRADRLQRRPLRVVVAALILAVATIAVATGAAGRARALLATTPYAEIAAAQELPRINADGCQLGMLDVVSPVCRYGAATSDSVIVLFGDSHAGQWFPALEAIAGERGWSLVTLVKTGCPSVSVTTMNASLGRPYRECDIWRRNAIERIAALRPTIVVVANARSYRVTAGRAIGRTDSTAFGLAQWRAGLARTLAAVRASGARVVVLQDTPRLPVHVPDCLMRNRAEPARCAGRAALAIDTVVADEERAVVQGVPGATFASLNGSICDGPACPGARDGIIRYYDTNHLTVRYSASLAPELGRVLSHSRTDP